MQIQRLHPSPASRALRGTWLEAPLVGRGPEPYVYADFLETLDGRIAIASPGAAAARYATPRQAQTKGDWRLFLELQARADVLVTHTGYLRSLAAGELGDVLHVPKGEDAAYLRDWRREHGLAPEPRVLVVSRSLDFDPDVLPKDAARVHVLTGAEGDAGVARELAARGIETQRVERSGLLGADDVIGALRHIGGGLAFLQTGPDLMHALLAGGHVRRLFLTIDLSLAGGEDVLSLARGPVFENAPRFRLDELYLADDSGRQQLLAALSPAPR